MDLNIFLNYKTRIKYKFQAFSKLNLNQNNISFVPRPRLLDLTQEGKVLGIHYLSSPFSPRL